MSDQYVLSYVAAVVVDGIVRMALRARTVRVGPDWVRVEFVRDAERATTRRDCGLLARVEFCCCVVARATTRRVCVLRVRGEFVCDAARARVVRAGVFCDWRVADVAMVPVSNTDKQEIKPISFRIFTLLLFI